MLKEFFLKNILARQLKDVPKEYQDKMMQAISANPDFFMKLAEEVKGNVKNGMGQLEATQKAVMKYQEDLKKMLEI